MKKILKTFVMFNLKELENIIILIEHFGGDEWMSKEMELDKMKDKVNSLFMKTYDKYKLEGKSVVSKEVYKIQNGGV